jgi:CheY-like chemotaxis protein
MMPAAMNVVLVDDDRIYQFAAKKTLEATGLVSNLQSFPNGKEALHFLQKAIDGLVALPDIIFLDINMPIMNGWQFLDAFREMYNRLPRKVPIYMVSSSIDEVDINKSKQYTIVSDYIIKPVHKERFRQLLAHHTAA